MNRKFTARQVIHQGFKVDTYILCVGGVKFGELHGLGNGGYAFFFNDQTRLVPWLETDADIFTWTNLKEAMETAKRLWERRESDRQKEEAKEKKPTKQKAKPEDTLTPPQKRRDGWVAEFVDGR